MNETILVEVSFPAAQLHMLARISIELDIGEVDEMLCSMLKELGYEELLTEEAPILFNERTRQILDPLKKVKECTICYGDRLLLIETS